MDITASRAETISALSDQADRRDPGRTWPWIALAGSGNHQVEVIRAQAAARTVPAVPLNRTRVAAWQGSGAGRWQLVRSAMVTSAGAARRR